MIFNYSLLTVLPYSYPAYARCKHPNGSLTKTNHNSLLQGWQQRSRIIRCGVSWGLQQHECGSDPNNVLANERVQWVAEPQDGLRNYCPSCAGDGQANGVTRLSVPSMHSEFERLIRAWRNENPRDISSADVQRMRADGTTARAQYDRDTLGGPYNYAEWNFHEYLRQFRVKWERHIYEKRYQRYQRESGPDWREPSSYIDPDFLF